jgi:hypothetical protein
MDPPISFRFDPEKHEDKRKAVSILFFHFFVLTTGATLISLPLCFSVE